MLIAHGPIAIIGSWLPFRKQIEKKRKSAKPLLLLFFFLAGILPDFDFFFLILNSNKSIQHHELITHTPIFWLICSIVLFLSLLLISKNKKLGKIFRKENIILLSTTFLISTLSHVFFDYITGYIMLFYPFSLHAYTLFGNILPSNIFSGYLFNPLFAIELLITTISVSALLVTTKFRQKVLIITLIILLPLTYIFFNFYLYNNNYHPAPMLNTIGMPIADLDRDGLLNQDDSDADNNGIDNFKQADRKEISNVAKAISESKVPIYSTNTKNILSRLNLLYGGVTVRRLIFESFWDQGNPLEPVIIDFANKNGIKTIKDATNQFFIQNITGLKLPVEGSLILVDYGGERYGIGIYINKENVVYEDIDGNPKIDKYENLKGLKIFTEN
ncbi:metal-dependent hydrolase [Candidatus Dojkabacteria bacterium]|jgi:hypothetical protein|nr:metal-dependent hydrolase [Candidatus Dojkabacteria bacterium]